MSEMYWRVAETKTQLDDARRVRWACLHEELALRARDETGMPGSGAQGDVSTLDVLPTVHHIVVYDGRRAVGTARLAQGNASAAHGRWARHGFEIEERLDLTALGLASSELGEVSRLCVQREHAGRACALLYEGLYVQSRSLGVRYWIGGVDCGTNDVRAARRLYEGLARQGLVSHEWRLQSKPEAPPAPTAPARADACISEPSSTRPRSTRPSTWPSTWPSAEPNEATAAVETELPVPRALGAFIRRLNARAIAAPVPHPRFQRYVLPMLAALDALPDSTLALFDSAAATSFPLPGPAWAALVHTAHDSLRQLDQHPVGRALIAGTLPRHQYVAYLTQVVHQVRDSAPLLAQAARRLEQLGRPGLARVFQRKAGEEQGHDEWALEDLQALGVSRQRALSAPCCSAVRAYGAWLRHCAEATPVAVLGLAFVLECFGSARAGRAATNLVRRSGIAGIASAVRFLQGHGAADEGHLRAFAEPFAQISAQDELEAILLSARLTSSLYLGMLDWAGAASAGTARELH